jgi:flagellar basal-body rod protein FlgG
LPLKKSLRKGTLSKQAMRWMLQSTGEGFFRFKCLMERSVYTRSGEFKLDQNGAMVGPNGYPINPAITIPQDAQSVTIGADGSVSVLQPGNAQPANVGQLQIANFINTAGLEPIGENMYRESAASGPAVLGTPAAGEFGTLVQNALETSNVNRR